MRLWVVGCPVLCLTEHVNQTASCTEHTHTQTHTYTATSYSHRCLSLTTFIQRFGWIQNCLAILFNYLLANAHG